MSISDSTDVVEVTLDNLEITSLISSIASLILAIVAIILSILFYKMSEKSSKEVEKSTNNINANVSKLELLFDKMYSDTFGMVKETVSDMREYVYKRNDEEKSSDKINEQIDNKMKEEINKKIDNLHKDTFSKQEIENLVLELINKSKDVEKDLLNKRYENRIEKLLITYNGLTFPELMYKLHGNESNKNNKIKKLNSKKLFAALESLVEKNVIESPFNLENNEKAISYNTTIRMK